MSDKKLTLSAVLDTTAFDASVKKMQQDLSKINHPTDQAFKGLENSARAKSMGLGDAMGGPSQEAFRKASQASRQELVNRLSQETKVGDAASKNADKRQREIRILESAQAKIVQGTEKELKIKELLVAKERELLTLRAQAAASVKNQSGILDAMEQNAKQAASPIAAGSPPTPPGGGANPPAPGPSDGGVGLLKMIGGAAAIGSIIQKTISTGLQVYRAYGEAPINTAVNTGSAMSGTFGSELRNAYAGRSGIESAYMPEKQTAMSVAQANLENRKGHDTASIYGTIGGAGAVGAAVGALGGIPGMAIGGAAGLIGGTAMALSNQRMRARMLGEASPRFKEEYESMNAKEYAENYQSDLEAEKKKNPLKSMALEEYQGRFQRNLDFQRSTGLDYSSFHAPGGFREQTINAGFGDDMGMGMGSSILGAGGSTRAAQAGGSILGLQMQRGYGLNNAGNVLGTLSSGLGSAESTREATIKLLTEGTRLGLDASQFRAENSKFTEIAAEAISRSGVSSGNGMNGVLDQMGSFYGGDKSMRGIDAGKSAYDLYQNMTGSTSGPTGALKMAGMLKDDKIKGFSAIDRGALLQMDSEQVNPDNQMVQDIAGRNNMMPDDLVKRMRKVHQSSMHRLDDSDKLENFIREKTGGKDVDYDTFSPEVKKAYEELRTRNSLEQPELANKPRELSQYTRGLVQGKGADRDTLAAGANDKLNNKDTGLVEDRTVQQNAEGSRLMLENFQKLGPTIGSSVESIRKFNEQLQHTVDIISKMPANERNSLFSQMFEKAMPSNQQQAGKPSK